MAIGQLADYKRFINGGVARLAVLVPSVPREDLLDLLEHEGIMAVWPETTGFTDSTGGGFIG